MTVSVVYTKLRVICLMTASLVAAFCSSDNFLSRGEQIPGARQSKGASVSKSGHAFNCGAVCRHYAPKFKLFYGGDLGTQNIQF